MLKQSVSNKDKPKAEFEVVDSNFANKEYLEKENKDLGAELLATEKENAQLKSQLEEANKLVQELREGKVEQDPKLYTKD